MYSHFFTQFRLFIVSVSLLVQILTFKLHGSFIDCKMVTSSMFFNNTRDSQKIRGLFELRGSSWFQFFQNPLGVASQGDADGFFDAKGVVHHEYLPQGSTVNQIYHIEVLKRGKSG